MMLIFVLKFTACLSILLLFYNLLLEKEDFHVFKRIYLIGAIVVSFVIPLITFTVYKAPITKNSQPITDIIITTEKTFNYLPLLLFGIYGIGVLFFSIKFFKNIRQILFRIKRNIKVKKKNYSHVLLNESITPHTFFRYIFFNKVKFENQEIPKEVILHEKTHALQMHSIDIVIIEFIQIIFWFHPLLYSYNKAIKLNHEFLADKAVLNSGISESKYQNILLAFSSNANYSPLANAINYSFIKKRFTVMKTQKSKKSQWIKSLLLLPLFSLLLFSFSTKVAIEKETNLIENITFQEGASKKQIKEYNKLAIKYNTQEKDNIIVRKKEVERLNYLFSIMTKAQKLAVEPFPYFPPPPHDRIVRGLNEEGENILPPSPPPAPKVIKGKNDKNSNIPPPPPPPKAPKTKEAKKKGKELKKKEKTLAIKNENLLVQQKILKEKQLALIDTKKEVFKANNLATIRKLKQEREKLKVKRKQISMERKKELVKKRQIKKEELRKN